MAISRPENIYLAAQLSPKSYKKQLTPSPLSVKKTIFDAEHVQNEAKSAAIKHVAHLLQRPDQLDKIDQHTKRIQRKKVMVETMLKSMIQTYLEGIHTGLDQLQKAKEEIKVVKEKIKIIHETYKDVGPLVNKLKDVKEESKKHNQYATAVNNLKHIYNVPEIIKKTNNYLVEGKLLHAHQCIMDMENSRDDLLYELHIMPTPNPLDINMIHRYYEDLQNLNEQLIKQLMYIAERLIPTARKEPGMVVTMARIIEREERSDAYIKTRFELTGFNPPGRPKDLKKKFFDVLELSIKSSLEGTQCEERGATKVWLVKHLEIIRMKYLDDLRVIKKVLPPCFPDHYDMFNVMTNIYHKALSQRLKELMEEELGGNDIITMLTWIKDYDGRELLGHPDLNIASMKLSPLLDEADLQSLTDKYLLNMQNNIQEWLLNTVKADKNDWLSGREPQKNDGMYYHTEMGNSLYEMCKQNINVAQQVSPGLTTRLVQMLINQMNDFSAMYIAGIKEYRAIHMGNRNLSEGYINYLIAISNNCQYFSEYMKKLREEIVDTEELDDMSRCILLMKFNNLDASMEQVAYKACAYILEDIFLDILPHMSQFLTKEWVEDHNVEGTIKATFDDYFQDLVHLKPKFYVKLISESEIRLCTEYLKALLAKRITFKSFEERKVVCDRIIEGANLFMELFEKIKLKPFNDFKKLEANVENYRLYNITTPVPTITTTSKPLLNPFSNTSAGADRFAKLTQTKPAAAASNLIQDSSNINSSSTGTPSPFATLIMIADIIKMRDITFLPFEVTTLLIKNKDVTIDQVTQILLLRGDMTRAEIKDFLVELPAAKAALAQVKNGNDPSGGALGGLSANLLQATRGITGRLVGGPASSEKDLSVSRSPSQNNKLGMDAAVTSQLATSLSLSENKLNLNSTPKLESVPSAIIEPEKSIFARIN